MPPSPSCSAKPIQRGVVLWSTLESPARSLNPQDWILEPLLVDDAKDPVDDDEDLGYGVEALVGDGEALDGLKKH